MAAAAAAQQLSIFYVIKRGDLEEVQRWVQADPGVMEEHHNYLWCHCTPLMYAIWCDKSDIALWLIKRRGAHDLETGDDEGRVAVFYACAYGDLLLLQALVQARADPARVYDGGITSLHKASEHGHADVVAYLLTFPRVVETIDADCDSTALGWACAGNHPCVVRLLLDAGADPTIPLGDDNLLSIATYYDRQVALSIAEPQRPRLLFKARCIVDATFAVRKAQRDNRGKPPADVRRHMAAAAPEYLKGRVGRGEELPQLVLTPTETIAGKRCRAWGQGPAREERRATLAYVLGMEGGPMGDGLPREVFTELLEMMVPRWDQPAARRP